MAKYCFTKPNTPVVTSALFIGDLTPCSNNENLPYIAQLFSPYGELEAVLPGRHPNSAYVVYKNESQATAAYQALRDQPCPALTGRLLEVKYSNWKVLQPPKCLPVSLSGEGLVPGLHLFYDFISPAQEVELLNMVKDQPWINLVKRRVQHYGHAFDYVLRNFSEKLGPLPSWVAPIAHKVAMLPCVNQDLDQLTVNEYPPGIGLAPHIDNHSSFEGPITSLSLGSDTVMEFRSGDDHRPLLLPRRSLLVLTGEARYAWLHYIPSRKTDVLIPPSSSDGTNGAQESASSTEGKVLIRDTRTSFTFRKIKRDRCLCPWPDHCDTQNSKNPPTRLATLLGLAGAPPDTDPLAPLRTHSPAPSASAHTSSAHTTFENSVSQPHQMPFASSNATAAAGQLPTPTQQLQQCNSQPSATSTSMLAPVHVTVPVQHYAALSPCLPVRQLHTSSSVQQQEQHPQQQQEQHEFGSRAGSTNAAASSDSNGMQGPGWSINSNDSQGMGISSNNCKGGYLNSHLGNIVSLGGGCRGMQGSKHDSDSGGGRSGVDGKREGCVQVPNGSARKTGSLNRDEGALGVHSAAAELRRMEEQHVHAVYDVIAQHFSATRFAIWPRVRRFIDEIEPGAIVADVGCGNGKYFGVRHDIAVLGSDRSGGLLEVAARRLTPGALQVNQVAHADVLQADALQLPYRTGSCDAVLCIAVLHHISSEARRLQLMGELVRILRPAGKAIITVWAAEQEDPEKTLKKWRSIAPPGQQQQQGEEGAPMDQPGLLASKGVVSQPPSEGTAAAASGYTHAFGQGNDEQGSTGVGDRKTVRGGDYFVPWHLPFHRAGTRASAAVQQQADIAIAEAQQGGAAFEGPAHSNHQQQETPAAVNQAKQAVVYQRYYHLFAQGELVELASRLHGAQVVDSGYDKSNWLVVVQKRAGGS